MAKKNHPRRGSLAYKPQRRAQRMYGDLTTADHVEDGNFAGFAGYKAGMTRVLWIDDEQNSATKGQEIVDPVTVLECPPLAVYGVRAYHTTVDGEQVMADAIADSVAGDLARTVKTDGNGDLEQIEDSIDDISDIRLLVHTQPDKSGMDKKRPEVFELPLGGADVAAKFEQASDLLGGEVTISDVFEPGQYVDVISVTTGKGFQGPVKRHGVKTLSHKTQKSSRKAGNVGPWHPDHLSWKVPLPGHMGMNKRTEHNKRLLDLGEDGDEVNPAGGFKNYGIIQDNYVLVKGSVPGPTKRLVMFRPAVREGGAPREPTVTHIRK